MAVTYADLVAFGFAYVEDSAANSTKNQTFVGKKSPPSLSPGDACLCVEEDFIILAEFSEVKGPVALLTVPSYIQQNEDIDINSFIMRIMSVDYQANPGGQFCICQDTQVLQTYISHNRHAYVHYLTLYDLYARGFVRPLCLAYVSTDQRKLHRIFPQLREHFLKITELMKVDNRYGFASELSSVLQEIKQMMSVLDEKSPETVDMCCEPGIKLPEKNKHKQHLLHQYTEFDHMLSTVQSSMVGYEYTQAALDHWRKALTLNFDVPEPEEVQQYIRICVPDATQRRIPSIHQSSDGTCVLDKYLRPAPTLNPWGTASALWRLTDVVRVFSHCELSVCVGGFPSLSVPQLSGGGGWEVESTDKDFVDLDCAWEALSQPEFLHLLYVVAVNALDASTLALEEQDSSKEANSGNEGSSSYHSVTDSGDEVTPQIPMKDYSNVIQNSVEQSCESTPMINNSNISLLDSYRSLHGTDSISIASIKEKESFISGENSKTTTLSDSAEENIIKPVSMPNGKSMKEAENHSDGISDNNSDDSESFHDILEVLHSDDNWSQGSASDDLASGTNWNHCLWTRHRPVDKSGHRLLKFFWTYRLAAQHVVFSLLTGRTLVLAGNSQSERRVSRVLNAISPLIPPLDTSGLRILRWHRGILVSAHIASYQVIGMCVPERLTIHDMISPRDKNTVTILDVNSEQLFGPAYHGHLLATLGNNVRDFPSDHSLLLFMHSVISGIGCKLSAYKAMVAARNNELPSHACRQLELHGCDADIVRYLSKLSL